MSAQRKRARQACLFCNSRRIRCNVTENAPCDNCIASKKPCHIRESRRGKYVRRRGASIAGQEPEQDVSDVKSDRTESLGHADDLTASHLLASLSQGKFPQNNVDQFDTADTPREAPMPEDGVNSDENSVFLGESTFVRYMQNEQSPSKSGSSPSENGRLLHPVSRAVEGESLVPSWETSRRTARIAALRKDGALSFPESPIVEALFHAYFQWFHSCFAVVNEPDIWLQYRKQTLSPLLLQAILFVGIIYSEDADLQRVGITNRHKAKFIFYNNAKDIYDVGYEACKITVIQSLFLLSFRRAGAMLEKDARHWLGAAIGLAESKAMHRSSASLEPKKLHLRKRLWWSIYVRERQCAAALGLPNRVRDEDCDAEALDLEDFEGAFDSSISVNKQGEYALYAIGMTSLSRILGRILHYGYLPNHALTSDTREAIKNELFSWKQQLAPPMNLESNFGKQSSLHANMLHLAYNNLLILLFRSEFIGGMDDGVEGQMAVQAAARNAHIVEDLLAPPGRLRYAQIHVITNLFNSLCIHTLRLRQLLEIPEEPRRSIAEHQARICLLGLREMQKTWGVKNWVLQLFFYYLDESTAARLEVNDIAQVGKHQLHEKMFGDGHQAQQQVVPSTVSCEEDMQAMETADQDMVMAGQDVSTMNQWPWSLDEVNRFLHTQIEGGFAFGEGNIINFDSEESPPYSNMVFDVGDTTNMWIAGDSDPW